MPRKPAAGTVSLYLRIAPGLKAWLQKYADSTGTTLVAVAEQALVFYLEHQLELEHQANNKDEGEDQDEAGN